MEEEKKHENKLNIHLTYPNSDEFDFFTKIEIVDLDKEAKQDIESGRGFIIDAPKSTNKKEISRILMVYIRQDLDNA